FVFFFSSRRRHTRSKRDWSSDVCSSDLETALAEILEQATAEKWRNSGIVDRHYFKALYISAVGNITVEISTDSPGFTIDEPLEKIGRASCRERVSVLGIAECKKQKSIES